MLQAEEQTKKTSIITYLHQGVSSGIQEVFIYGDNLHSFVIPRGDVEYSEVEPCECIYFLVGKNYLYVGQTQDIKERIKNHDKNKYNWEKVVVFLRDGDPFNKSEVLYLEYLCITTINKIEVDYEKILNQNKPKEPTIHNYMKQAIIEAFNKIKIIIDFLNYPFFLEAKQEGIVKKFYCKLQDGTVDAIGFYDDVNKKFTVEKNSLIRMANINQDVKEVYLKTLEKLKTKSEGHLENGKLKNDITFESLSSASSFCLGRSSNGWTAWRDENGKPISDFYRE